jgi:hypothetical protein
MSAKLSVTAAPHLNPLPREGEGIACGHASPLGGEAGHVVARCLTKTWTGEGSWRVFAGPH